MWKKMRWMTVRLSGAGRWLHRNRRLCSCVARPWKPFAFAIRRSRSWKSFQPKLPKQFSSSQDLLIWFADFWSISILLRKIFDSTSSHWGLGAVYTKLGWSEEAMIKMIEAQEAFQVGLGMVSMYQRWGTRDAENMLNMNILLCYTFM